MSSNAEAMAQSLEKGDASDDKFMGGTGGIERFFVPGFYFRIFFWS